MTSRLVHGDCLIEMAKMEANSVDGIFGDPPYCLEFMGEEWDKFKQGANIAGGTTGIDTPFGRKRALPAFYHKTLPTLLNFQHWTQAWAAEALRVLKPGGYLMAFGGTRTSHRLVCGLEDAGFVIRDTLCWLYGSGFPKSLNISKAFDKKNGRKQSEYLQLANYLRIKRTEKKLSQRAIAKYFPSKTGGLTGCVCNWEKGINVPTLQQWRTLKQLLGLDNKFDGLIERIEAEREIVGEKKAGLGSGKTYAFTDNNRTNGIVDVTIPTNDLAKTWDGYGTALKPAHEPIVLAQKPRDGTYCQNIEKWGCGVLNIDACRIKVNPDIDDMLRETSRKKRQADTWETGSGFKNEKNNLTGVRPAGRFPANLILDEKAAQVLDGQSGILKSGSGCIRRKEGTFLEHGGLGKAGDVQITYGDQAGASRFFYCAKASRKERGKDNIHPTVKPIKLLMYLARLVLPHHKPVVWLDPFVGSGSSALAASKLNDEEGYQISFIGIDQEEKYLEIAKQRLAKYNKCVQLRIPLCPSGPV